MFVNINFNKRQITLISIPRDLYYNNRKINAIYSRYGIAELERSITNIIGYKIDKFVMVDMYSFIDIVNVLGGIDVHLDKPVIDPTYKTYDGGVWSTLYYRAGDYHLNGVQALRIARSRHTSSDFDRATRQQLILQAIQKKAQEGGFGNDLKLTKLAKIILEKVQTNISLPEAIGYYFKFQNFKIIGGNVLSTANILQSTHINADGVTQCEEDIKNIRGIERISNKGQADSFCKVQSGAYILLPRNGNWSVIKWYVHHLLD